LNRESKHEFDHFALYMLSMTSKAFWRRSGKSCQWLFLKAPVAINCVVGLQEGNRRSGAKLQGFKEIIRRRFNQPFGLEKQHRLPDRFADSESKTPARRSSTFLRRDLRWRGPLSTLRRSLVVGSMNLPKMILTATVV
jgi:hypothetical protein